MRSAAIPDRRLRALLRDLATGMRQQMFYWGRDVVHPDGNLFLKFGFAKQPCERVSASSLYRLPWQGGTIELHGSQAGWFGPDGGFVYLRPVGRCYHWLAECPPVPGAVDQACLDAADPEMAHRLAVPFLDWWLSFEKQVVDRHGASYRRSCFRHFARLPKSRSWLSHEHGIRWVKGLRDEPDRLPRARRFVQTTSELR